MNDWKPPTKEEREKEAEKTQQKEPPKENQLRASTSSKIVAEPIKDDIENEENAK